MAAKSLVLDWLHIFGFPSPFRSKESIGQMLKIVRVFGAIHNTNKWIVSRRNPLCNDWVTPNICVDDTAGDV